MQQSPFPWPNGAAAAVSLTYDDGIPNQIDIAMPALERAGFRGTFYPTVGSRQFQERQKDWRAAQKHGHEIGSHTWNHPGRDLPGEQRARLEDYTAARIKDEVRIAAEWLDRHIGPDPERTFAYPYAHNAIGVPPNEKAYADAVAGSHSAARLGGGRVPNDPWTVDFRACRGFSFGPGTPLEKLVTWCSAALDCGGWTILDFHGIGGTTGGTSAETHSQLLDYLSANPFWVAPVRDVVRWIDTIKRTPAQ